MSKDVGSSITFFFIIAVGLTLLPGQSYAESALGNIWYVSRLAKLHGHVAPLKDRYGKNYKNVSTRQMRMLHNSFLKLRDAADMEARFLIIEGNQPNAFAGPVDRRATVAINFAMLDLVGSQKDEWAATLGHELAHLKLNHYRSSLYRKLSLDLLGRYI